MQPKIIAASALVLALAPIIARLVALAIDAAFYALTVLLDEALRFCPFFRCTSCRDGSTE